MTSNEQTAQQRYNFNHQNIKLRMQNIKLRMQDLQQWLEEDKKQFEKDPGNWGHVGTLSNISTSLGDILDSFNIDPLGK